LRGFIFFQETIFNSTAAAQAKQAAQKTQQIVILREAKNPSLFLCLNLDRREILRFAQNDKPTGCFLSL